MPADNGVFRLVFLEGVDMCFRLVEGTTDSGRISVIVGPYVWGVVLGQPLIFAIPVSGCQSNIVKAKT